MSKKWHSLEIKKIEEILKSDLKNGLTEKEVRKKQKRFGKNELPEETRLRAFKILLSQFKDPLIYILLGGGIITLFLKDLVDTLIIFGVVILNTSLGFFQEFKAQRILQNLKKMMKVKAFVMRERKKREILQEDLVPGDIFFLNPGDKVPADGRLIETHGLKVNESILTGEWLSVEKDIQTLPPEIPLAERKNMVYMGTVVEEGFGKAIVTEIGENTEVGKIASLIKEIEEEDTPYQRKVKNFSRILLLVILFFSALVFSFGLLAKTELGQMLKITVAMIVAVIPEGLPAAVTFCFAFGAREIFKKKGLIKRIIATETLGSTSIICTDKTGTLTEGKMQVARIFSGSRELFSDGKKYSERMDKNGRVSHLTLLKIATFCNDAFIENPEDALEKWIVRGTATEKALLLAGIQAGLKRGELEKKEPRILRVPFDPTFKYSLNLHQLNERENILYVLGAPEIILEKSGFLDIDGKAERLSLSQKEEIKNKIEKLAEEGQRILAGAYRIYPKKETQFNQSELENLRNLCKELIFVGLISLHDPLREEVKNAIETCQEAGMRVIIVTGDHKLTAKAIAEKIGLRVKSENILEGKDLDGLSEEEFEKKGKEIKVYARVEPRHKLKIVRFWQEKGEIVAMTGDGVNDAPALRRADIGIALGSGTEVAKTASDMVLLDNNFSTILETVKEGRRIIDNIRKIITFFLIGGFTELIIVGFTLISRLFIPGLPLPILASQILWKNLIEDSPPAMALSLEPPEKGVMKRKPEPKELPLLTKEMKALIFIIGIISDLFLFFIFLWLWFHPLYGPEKIDLLRTVVFAGLGIDSFFFIFSFRNLKKNIWQYHPFSNVYLTLSALSGFFFFGLAIYFPPLQKILHTVSLSLREWMILISYALVKLSFIELTKWYFIQKEFEKR